MNGVKVTAGQRLGTTGTAFGVDLGVVNSTVTLGFVNPSRYTNSDTLHADAPLKYYEEPLRSALYERVQRLGAERDGKIDHDVAGRLSGNWFVESASTPLAFVYDTYNPSEVRISVGGGLSLIGVFAIAADEPLPRDVSVASGKVRYTLTRSVTGPPVPGTPAARMLVQMTDNQRIRVEVFSLADSAEEFTAAARVFVR